MRFLFTIFGDFCLIYITISKILFEQQYFDKHKTFNVNIFNEIHFKNFKTITKIKQN